MKINDFCCCCCSMRVETGTIIIGGLGAFVGIFEAISSFFTMMLAFFANDLFMSNCPREFQSICSAGILIVVICVLFFAFTIFKVYAHFSLIMAVEKTDGPRFKPGVIFYQVLLGLDIAIIVGFFVGAVAFSGTLIYGAFMNVLPFLINLYLYAVITSARDSIENNANLPVYFKAA